jgi:hypothetical protein
MEKFLNVIGSPRFWALIIALAFILLKAFVPVIPLNEDEVTAAVIALVGFIAAVSVNPAPTVWAELLKSGKFWALLASLVFIFVRAFAPAFPLSEAQVLAIIVALTGVSIGTSYRPINNFRE